MLFANVYISFWLCVATLCVLLFTQNLQRAAEQEAAADYIFKKMRSSSFLITVMICNTGRDFLANCESVESVEEKEIREDYLDRLHTLQEIVKSINVTENNVKERFRVTVGSTGTGAQS